MISQDLNWVGLELGDYKIEQKLGEGVFSCVYGAVDVKTGQRKAIKAAKLNDLVRRPAREECLSTKAIAQITGSTMDVLPDASAVLRQQHMRLSAAKAPGWVNVERLVDQPGLTYYEMELVQGETLKQQITKTPVTVDQTISIARTLDKLSQGADHYHGDIKPENILLTKSGITMIDPGFFGRLKLSNGTSLPNCAVTTVAYYPTLEPDDLFAFGLMLWEIVLGLHPTAKTGNSQESDLSKIGANLLETVRLQEMVGKYFLSSILDVPLPSSVHPGISPDLERLLLKSIRLQVITSGKLDLDAGFRSFSAVAGALAALRLKGNQQFLS